MIAVWLLSTFKSSAAIASDMAVCALVSVVAALALKERSGQDYSAEHGDLEARGPAAAKQAALG